MQKTLRIAVALMVTAALVWQFAPLMKFIGLYNLNVRVSGGSDPLRSVSCVAFDEYEDAERAAAQQIPPGNSQSAATADPFDGEPLTIPIRTKGLMSFGGVKWNYSQPRHLVVIAQLADGKKVGRLVEIPDGRVSRDLSVSLP